MEEGEEEEREREEESEGEYVHEKEITKKDKL